MEAPGERIHEGGRGRRGQAVHADTALRLQSLAALTAIEASALGRVTREALEFGWLPLRKRGRGAVCGAEFEVRGEGTKIR